MAMKEHACKNDQDKNLQKQKRMQKKKKIREKEKKTAKKICVFNMHSPPILYIAFCFPNMNAFLMIANDATAHAFNAPLYHFN